jgi:MFS family permease
MALMVDVAGSRSDAQRSGMFSSLRWPEFRLLWINALIFIFAVTAQGIARSWLALNLTGSNAGLAGVQLASGVAMLAGTPLGGLLADRVAKRTVVTATMSSVALSSAWIGSMVVTHDLQYWMLIAASVIQGTAFAFYSPARIAYISELVDKDMMGNAVVLSQLGYAGMLSIGPAIAGVLISISAVGPQGIFFGSGVICAVSALSTRRLPLGRQQRTERRSSWHDTVAGLRYIRNTDPLILFAVTSLAVVFIAFPYVTFLPSVAKLFHGGSALYGAMSALVSAGAVVAGIFVAFKSARRANLCVIFTVAGFVLGIALLGLATAPVLPLALIALVIIGGSVLTFQSTNQAMIMERSESEYHGRLQSVVLLGYSGNGLMALPLGVLADAAGLHVAFGIMAAVTLVCMVPFTAKARKRGLYSSP